MENSFDIHRAKKANSEPLIKINLTHPFSITKNLPYSLGCLVCSYTSHNWLTCKLQYTKMTLKELKAILLFARMQSDLFSF